MGKRDPKTESVEVVTSAASQPESRSVEETQPSPSTNLDDASEPQEGEPVGLVVCAYPGTESLLRSVWGDKCKEPFVVVTTEESYLSDVRNLLADLIANEAIADDFVLVLPNTVPCAAVSESELKLSTVYVDKTGKKAYLSRLPMSFNKEALVDALANPDNDPSAKTSEAFIQDYAKKHWLRPVEVSHNFGNYVTMVLRGNPCENVVIEGFVLRKFICANEVGFSAIKGLIEQHLAK